MVESVKAKATLPEWVAKHKFEKRDMVFRTLDKNIILSLSIIRDAFSGIHDKEWFATCGLYLYFGSPDRKTKKDKVPAINVSHWFTSAQSKDFEKVRLICHAESVRLTLPSADVLNIAPDERDRLRDFLKELRGVKFTYVADLFGFLNGDDSDKEVVMELGFPRGDEHAN